MILDGSIVQFSGYGCHIAMENASLIDLFPILLFDVTLFGLIVINRGAPNNTLPDGK